MLVLTRASWSAQRCRNSVSRPPPSPLANLVATVYFFKLLMKCLPLTRAFATSTHELRQDNKSSLTIWVFTHFSALSRFAGISIALKCDGSIPNRGRIWGMWIKCTFFCPSWIRCVAFAAGLSVFLLFVLDSVLVVFTLETIVFFQLCFCILVPRNQT